MLIKKIIDALEGKLGEMAETHLDPHARGTVRPEEDHLAFHEDVMHWNSINPEVPEVKARFVDK